MPRERESQMGLLSGLLAAVMIIALSVMAMNALQPAQHAPTQLADLKFSRPALPDLPPMTVPDAGQFARK